MFLLSNLDIIVIISSIILFSSCYAVSKTVPETNYKRKQSFGYDTINHIEQGEQDHHIVKINLPVFNNFDLSKEFYEIV